MIARTWVVHSCGATVETRACVATKARGAQSVLALGNRRCRAGRVCVRVERIHTLSLPRRNRPRPIDIVACERREASASGTALLSMQTRDVRTAQRRAASRML
jgi:hypothetical protein